MNLKKLKPLNSAAPGIFIVNSTAVCNEWSCMDFSSAPKLFGTTSGGTTLLASCVAGTMPTSVVIHKSGTLYFGSSTFDKNFTNFTILTKRDSMESQVLVPL